jgi:hypothetical protein
METTATIIEVGQVQSWKNLSLADFLAALAASWLAFKGKRWKLLSLQADDI